MLIIQMRAITDHTLFVNAISPRGLKMIHFIFETAASCKRAKKKYQSYHITLDLSESLTIPYDLGKLYVYFTMMLFTLTMMYLNTLIAASLRFLNFST